MKKPFRPRDIRGTNYYASATTSIEKTVLSICRKKLRAPIDPRTEGFFDPLHNQEELRVLANLGLNNVRLWSSFWAWMVKPTDFKTTLAEIRDNCRSLGLSITYIVWNSVSTRPEPDVPALAASWAIVRMLHGRNAEVGLIRDDIWAKALSQHESARLARLLPSGEPWFASQIGDPGTSVMAKYRSMADLGRRAPGFDLLMESYLVDVAEVMSVPGSPLVSYDLFNEPDYGKLLFRYPDMHLDVIERTHRVLRREHARRNPAIVPHFTVGFAGLSELSQVYLRQMISKGFITYVSSHAYRTIPDLQSFARTIQLGARIASGRNLDYVCSEFWERRLMNPPPAPIAPYLNILAAQSPPVGGQAWSLLENNIFSDEGLGGRIPTQAIDGLMRPRRGQYLPQGSPNTWPASLTFDQTATASDLAAVRLWTRS